MQDPNKPSTDDERLAARLLLRDAILRARDVLSWNEIVHLLAECPIDEARSDKPPTGKHDRT